MVVDDQREVIEFLLTPQAYGGDVSHVVRIDTHASAVFLAGDRAYKLKRAVRYDYLDFSTPERRRTLCEVELALNRRTAPSLYLGVVPVTREPNRRLALGGRGTAVDWLVRMARFDQDALLDRMAARNALDLDVMPLLASSIAALHEGAEWRPNQGGRAGMAWVIDGNARGFAEEGAGILAPVACGRVTAAARASLARHAERLEARRAAGFVRVCHGDLHLRNIVLLDGRPTLFDAVEFNEQISCIDVLYDLAFLLMDLWRLNLRTHANVLFNAYLELTDRLSALALLPLFLSCRSAVRAKTSATAASLQADGTRARELEATAREYLSRADELLQPPSPRLVAIGGLTGTGKSALARHLAADIGPAPGAVILRSDVIRKSLCGVSTTTRLGPEGYTGFVTAQVYRTLVEKAVEALQAGHAVIADAVFGCAWQRAAIAEASRTAGVRFTGLWLEAPVDVMSARVQARSGDASDATVAVLHEQLQHNLESIDWERIDASGNLDEVRRRAQSVLLPQRAPVR